MSRFEACMIDLSKTSNLTPQEEALIALRMQVLAIDAIFRADALRPRDLVFHGGNSLRLCWRSQRFSEDLDFMVSQDAADRLAGVIDVVVGRIEAALQPDTPGCKIQCKPPKEDTEKSVLRWDIKWEHPARFGKVLLKLEFMRVKPQILAAYPAKIRAMDAAEELRASVVPIVHAATLEGVLADKLVAIACRKYLKRRDLYDLDHLILQGAGKDVRAAAEAAVEVGLIYGESRDVVYLGLKRAYDDPKTWNEAQFELEMQRWLPDETFRAVKRAGQFVAALGRVRQFVGATANELQAQTALQDLKAAS